MHTYIDISCLFHLEDDTRAFATVFPKMKGLFGLEVQPNKDFGEDIFEKSMLITGIPRENHFHSDELEKNAVRRRSLHPCGLSIDRDKFKGICDIVNPDVEDAVVVVVGPERRAMHALKKIVERAKIALEGVPQETRRLLPNGNTEFLRVIHGKERIYPDTDTPPIVISKELVEDSKKKVGRCPWEVYEELHRKYGLNQNQTDLLIRAEKVDKFFQYVEDLRLNSSLAYHLLIELPLETRRKGKRMEMRTIEHLAKALSQGRIIPEQIGTLLEIFVKDPDMTITDALKKIGFQTFTEKELEELIHKKTEFVDSSKARSDAQYRRIAVAKVVGETLKAVNHSVSGKIVAQKVNALLIGE
jgi:glutamyl-tRNA(Gln) amidotransferase subunit E